MEIPFWIAIPVIAAYGLIGLARKGRWGLIGINVTIAILYACLIFWIGDHAENASDKALYYLLFYGCTTVHSIALVLQLLLLSEGRKPK